MEKTKFIGTIKYISAENHCKFEIRYANGEDGFRDRVYQVKTTQKPDEIFLLYRPMYDTPRLREQGIKKGLSIEDMIASNNMRLVISTTEYEVVLPFVGMRTLVKRVGNAKYFHGGKIPEVQHGTLMPSEVFNETIYHATSDVWMSVHFEAVKVGESQRPIGDSFGMTVSGVKRNDIYQLLYAEGAEDVVSYEFLTGSDGKRGYRHLLINGVLVTNNNGHINNSLCEVLHEDYKSGVTKYVIAVNPQDEVEELYQHSAYGNNNSVDARCKKQHEQPKVGNNPFEGLDKLLKK